MEDFYHLILQIMEKMKKEAYLKQKGFIIKDNKLEDILIEKEEISIENTTNRTKDLNSKIKEEEKKIEPTKKN